MANVPKRRELHFSGLRDMLADAERAASSNVRVLGNWSLGQILLHLARGLDVSIDGIDAKLSWPMRTVGKVFKKRILTGPMRAGINLPEAAQRQLNPGPTSIEAGLKSLREAIERLERTPERKPNMLLGQLTREEWDQFHLRHAEHHLGFVVFEPEPGREAG